jgi:Tfp pilus assembly protein PilF
VKCSYLAMIAVSFAIGARMCPEAWCQAQTDSGKAAEWIERGNADLDRYFFTNAEADFRKAIALQPDSGPAHLLLARVAW